MPAECPNSDLGKMDCKRYVNIQFITTDVIFCEYLNSRLLI